MRQTNRGRVQGGNAWCASKRDRATRDACQTGSTAGSLTITFRARNQNTTESRWKKGLEVAKQVEISRKLQWQEGIRGSGPASSLS